MLKRIKIQGYKSLVDLELNLKPLSVLVGPNASGKSNFLDALQLLSRIATCHTLEEAFDPPYRGHPLESFTFGGEGIKSLLEKERVSFSIEVDVQLSNAVIESVNQRIQKIRETAEKDTQSADKPVPKQLPPVREENLRYRIEMEMLPKLGILRVADEYLAALSADGKPKQKQEAFLRTNPGIGCICGWRDSRIHSTMNVILTLVSFRGRTTHPTIHIWLRCSMSWRTGLLSTLSPESRCGSQIPSRRFTILD